MVMRLPRLAQPPYLPQEMAIKNKRQISLFTTFAERLNLKIHCAAVDPEAPIIDALEDAVLNSTTCASRQSGFLAKSFALLRSFFSAA
jgi:hypothetical protein